MVVRLIVGEIVPAFRGIAEKLVPGAIPAIDCPVVFPYAPNAVLIGFLVSFLGGIVGLFILVFINSAFAPVALILPGVIPHFFCGATAGVFACRRWIKGMCIRILHARIIDYILASYLYAGHGCIELCQLYILRCRLLMDGNRIWKHRAVRARICLVDRMYRCISAANYL